MSAGAGGGRLGPPRRARTLLERLLPSGERRLLEFLDEVHQVHVQEEGRRRADRWYWGQTVRAPLRVWTDRLRRAALRGEETMAAFSYELRHAVRRMVRAPGFTAVVVLTLGLGVGASAAIYSLVKGVLLDPLPYPDADRLVALRYVAPGLASGDFEQSEATYLFNREHSRTLEGIGIWNWQTSNLTLEGREAERIGGAACNAGLFDVLGAVPEVGRLFSEAEEAPDADPVVVLGHALWQRLYGGDPSAVGRTIELNGVATEIVGVLEAGFHFPDPTMEFLVPYRFDHSAPTVAAFFLQGIGKRAPDASIADVREELDGLLYRMPEEYPHELLTEDAMRAAHMGAVVRSLTEQIVGDVRSVLWTLLATVGFVLLVSCANVANLFLVRAEGRGREVAVRAALGAGRSGMVRFFLAESALLGLAGGLVGLGIAFAAVRLLVTRATVDIPRLDEVAVDGGVLLFTLLVTLTASALFGVYPMLRYGGGRLFGGLREGGRSVAGGVSALKVRNGLVVAQVALALVLLMGSALMARSFWQLSRVDPGFEPAGVLTARMFLQQAAYPDQASVAATFQRIVDRLAAVPGVESAAAVSGLPMISEANRSGVWVEGHPVAEGALPDVRLYRFASPGYFRTLGIPLLQGRAFERRDHESRAAVCVVSRSFADTYWPDGDVLGRRIRRRPNGEWHTVVGVVGDVHDAGLDLPLEPTIYLPMNGPVGDPEYEYYPSVLSVAVRATAGDPASLLPGVRRAVREIAPRAPLSNVQTMRQVVARSMGRTTFTMALLGLAAGVSLLLGAIGIYGVISWVVGQRAREIGVRLALGAGRRQVRRMVVRQGLMLAAVGLALGLLASMALGRYLSSLLYRVGTLDPLALVGAALVLLGACLAACWLPARRAAAVEPVEALRAE